MRIAEQVFSTEEWEQRIGNQVRAMRISAGLEQAELAMAAGISIGAVRNLERGRGSTVRTLVRTVHALDRDDWLESLAPQSSVSPLDLIRSVSRPRSRVYRPRGERA
jgi:transcriptional regulator with XRE-family HTH domain